VEDKDLLDIQEGENVGCEGGYAAEESEAFYSDGEVFRLHPIPAKLTDTCACEHLADAHGGVV
jgi:hypothetical protein